MVAGDGPAAAYRLDDVAGIAVVSALADGGKCARCWMVLPEGGTDEGSICGRCADAVA